MDFKIGLPPINTTPARSKEPIEKTIKSDSATDRDGNGQMSQGDQQKKHQPMSEEQVKAAIEHLRALEVVKTLGLQVILTEVNSRKVVLLQDAQGKVLRRIMEDELATLQVAKDTDTGQLLRKTA